jgi:hypothetical protein
VEIIFPSKYNNKKSKTMTCMMTDYLKGLTSKILNCIDVGIDLIALLVRVV